MRLALTRNRACRSWRSAASPTSSSPAVCSRRSAHSATTTPAGVSVDPRGLRATSCTPVCRSTAEILAETACWLMPTSRPAAFRLPERGDGEEQLPRSQLGHPRAQRHADQLMSHKLTLLPGKEMAPTEQLGTGAQFGHDDDRANRRTRGASASAHRGARRERLPRPCQVRVAARPRPSAPGLRVPHAELVRLGHGHGHRRGGRGLAAGAVPGPSPRRHRRLGNGGDHAGGRHGAHGPVLAAPPSDRERPRLGPGDGPLLRRPADGAAHRGRRRTPARSRSSSG